MKTRWLSSLALAAGILLVGANFERASASVITQTVITTGSTCDQCGWLADFQQFNPSLGTLEAVNLTVTGDVSYEVQFALDPSCPFYLQFYSSCFAEAWFSTGYTINGPSLPYEDPLETDAFFAIEDFFATASPPNLNPQFSGQDRFSFAESPTSLLLYIGLGTVELKGAISEDSDYCNEIGVDCFQSDSLFVNTSLHYVYQPVPEPSSVSLFVAALMGLLAIFRPTKRQPIG